MMLSTFSCICWLLVLYILGFWTQGLTLARQVLYHLSHAPSPFLLSDKVLYFLLEVAFDCDPPTYASHVTRILKACSTMPWFVEMWFHWPQNLILPISASWVTSITSICHHTQDFIRISSFKRCLFRSFAYFVVVPGAGEVVFIILPRLVLNS
jgi:hypothetical protein